MTNKHKQVRHPDGFDEGTYRLAVCNECFATSNKVVCTKPDERALAEEVPDDRRSNNCQPHVPSSDAHLRFSLSSSSLPC